MSSKNKNKHHPEPVPMKKKSQLPLIIGGIAVVCIVIALVIIFRKPETVVAEQPKVQTSLAAQVESKNKWIERAEAVTNLFHVVYTPCWEGAYGAIGDAYLFAATKDSSLLRFHLYQNDLRRMCTGTWVDDRAWVCLAEFAWWNVTGKQYNDLIIDARSRYLEAKEEGRLSNHEGFWSWYNWSPTHRVNERIFTNGAINQMATVACALYEATGEKQFLEDALLVWNGDKKTPGVEKTLYKGKGVWQGKPGRAAFGKQIAWNGTEYCALGAALYRVTKDEKYKKIVVETVQHTMNPANGWVDAQDYYQIAMDGNGAFVNYLLDAYAIAPDELHDLLPKIEKMLDHVWSNNNGMASVKLHREGDHAIRNGWNPHGGEDGYNVDEVGTVHAQGEAARAFGVFAYYITKNK